MEEIRTQDLKDIANMLYGMAIGITFSLLVFVISK